MAEQLPLSSKKRKRNEEEEEASSGGSCTQKMDLRQASEQRLLTEALRTIALPRNEVASILDYISEELLRLRKVKKFTYEKLYSYLDAWEHELRTGIGPSQLFKNAKSDRVKMKISNMVLKKQHMGG